MTGYFECKKAENCFSESQTYEYRLPCSMGEQFLNGLGAAGALTCRRQIRRPFFTLDLPGNTHVKGVIGDDLIKASFPSEGFEECKARFEELLVRLVFAERGGDGGEQDEG